MTHGIDRESITWPFAIALAVGLWVLTPAQSAHARPGLGASCANCHADAQDGLMEVSGEDTTLDLGTQLDGNTRGELKTFEASPGDTVSVSMTVLDGTPSYAVQLKGLETGGQQNDQANKLVWTEAIDASNPWSEWGPPPYFAKDDNGGGIVWGGAPATYAFNLLIDPTTPLDVYNLQFVMATGAFGNDDEHFYLHVVPEPSSMALIGFGLAGIGLLGRGRIGMRTAQPMMPPRT